MRSFQPGEQTQFGLELKWTGELMRPPPTTTLDPASLGLADNSSIQLPWAQGLRQGWQAAQNRAGGQAFHSSLPLWRDLELRPLYSFVPPHPIPWSQESPGSAVRPGARTPRFSIAPLPTCCVTLNKFLHLSGPHPNQKNYPPIPPPEI